MRLSNRVRDGDGWETKSRETRFIDDHLEVVTETVKTPARDELRNWTVVYRKPAVVIAPMTAEGKFVLVRQERLPVRCDIWEMPAGQIDETETPNQAQIEATALREMKEETGYALSAGGELISLGDYFASPGFTNEREYLFLARPVERVTSETDPRESILACRLVSADELRQMIRENEIRDANTLSIFARLTARGLLAPS